MAEIEVRDILRQYKDDMTELQLRQKAAISRIVKTVKK